MFFYIKTPLRVREAGLEELIPTTWWPTHFDKEVKHVSVWVFACSLCWVFGFVVEAEADRSVCCLSVQGKDEWEPKDESSDERLRRRAYERGCQRLKKRIEGQS